MLAESLFLLSLFGSFAYPHSFESTLVEPITIAYSPSETGTAFFSDLNRFYRDRDLTLALSLPIGQTISGFEADGCDAGGGPIYLKVAGRTDLEYRHFPSSLLEVDTQ